MKKQSCELLRLVALGSAITLATACDLAAQGLETVVAAWEERLDARIGAVLHDTSSDWQIALRPQERFPMNSTFKSLLCGAVLARVDADEEDLNRRVHFNESDLVT